MTAKEMEKRLLEMQGQFGREKDAAKKAQIRVGYIDLHRRWVAEKSQLTLGRAA